MQNINIRQVYDSSYFDIYAQEFRIGTVQRLDHAKHKYIAMSVYTETDIAALIQPNRQAVVQFDDLLDAVEHLYRIHALKQQISL